MSEGLCYKCRQAILDKWGNKAFFLPSQHCHHEPKEKLKCWCEYDRLKKIQLNYAPMNRYDITNIGVPYTPNFCPECGRKL
jgi:hypothetical protein